MPNSINQFFFDNKHLKTNLHPVKSIIDIIFKLLCDRKQSVNWALVSQQRSRFFLRYTPCILSPYLFIYFQNVSTYYITTTGQIFFLTPFYIYYYYFHSHLLDFKIL